jgi:predicted nucleotidyltransferase
MSIEQTVLEKQRALAPRPVPAELIPTMVERIVREFEPVQIILFGSQARGEARWDSDVDLLVVLPAAPDKHKAAVAFRRALRDVPVAKDIIVSTPDEIARYGDVVGTMLGPALREGRILYTRACRLG